MDLIKYHSKLEYEFFKNFISLHTQRSYFNDLVQFFSYLASNIPIIKELKDIQAVHIVSYRNHISSFAPKTIGRKLSCLSTYFNFLLEKGIIKINPVLGIKRPRQEIIHPTLDLTDEEVANLMDAIQGESKSIHLHRAIIYLLLYSGIRKSELINLKVKDLKKEGDFVTITVRAKGGKFLKKAIHPECATAIFDYLEHLKNNNINVLEDDYLFRPTHNPKDGNLNKKLVPNSIDYIVKLYVLKAKIAKNITPHSLRATFIGSAIENGVSILDVARDVGHSSIKTTELYNKRKLKLENSPTFKLGYKKIDNL